MAVASLAHPFFKAYLFLVFFGRADVTEAALRLGGRPEARPVGGPVRATAVWSDPFADPPEVWLSAGIDDGTMLGEVVAAEEAAAAQEGRPPCLCIALTHRDGKLGRMLSARFKSHRWAPLHLDATSEKVAEEWVVLEGVEYTVS